MNSLNFLRIACVAFIGIGLAACPPVTSKTPIGTTVKAVRDPALAGVWRGKVADGDAVSYFTFLPQDDGTYSVVLVTPPSAKDNGGFGVFGAETVTLGHFHFINARELTDENKAAKGAMADNTIPLLYRLEGDNTLVLYLVDEDAAQAAIKTNKIKGTIEEGQFGDVTLTASPGELDAFMASPAARALFTKPLVVLKKVK
jgi:hypothetical protein